MADDPNALCERAPLSHVLSQSPAARLLSQMWTEACTDVDDLDRQGDAPQELEAALMLKTDLATEIEQASCESLHGVKLLLEVALDAARTADGPDLDPHWAMVERAYLALNYLTSPSTLTPARSGKEQRRAEVTTRRKLPR